MACYLMPSARKGRQHLKGFWPIGGGIVNCLGRLQRDFIISCSILPQFPSLFLCIKLRRSLLPSKIVQHKMPSISHDANFAFFCQTFGQIETPVMNLFTREQVHIWWMEWSSAREVIKVIRCVSVINYIFKAREDWSKTQGYYRSDSQLICGNKHWRKVVFCFLFFLLKKRRNSVINVFLIQFKLAFIFPRRLRLIIMQETSTSGIWLITSCAGWYMSLVCGECRCTPMYSLNLNM